MSLLHWGPLSDLGASPPSGHRLRLHRGRARWRQRTSRPSLHLREVPRPSNTFDDPHTMPAWHRSCFTCAHVFKRQRLMTLLEAIAIAAQVRGAAVGTIGACQWGLWVRRPRRRLTMCALAGISIAVTE